MNNYDYPIGADSISAPWNQEDNPEREIEVLVSITMSKTVKVKVSDYQITDSGKDEDGEYYEDIDYSECDLKYAVESQIVLPPQQCNTAIDEAIGNIWNVDDFEVILEN